MVGLSPMIQGQQEQEKEEVKIKNYQPSLLSKIVENCVFSKTGRKKIDSSTLAKNKHLSPSKQSVLRINSLKTLSKTSLMTTMSSKFVANNTLLKNFNNDYAQIQDDNGNLKVENVYLKNENLYLRDNYAPLKCTHVQTSKEGSTVKIRSLISRFRSLSQDSLNIPQFPPKSQEKKKTIGSFLTGTQFHNKNLNDQAFNINLVKDPDACSKAKNQINRQVKSQSRQTSTLSNRDIARVGEGFGVGVSAVAGVGASACVGASAVAGAGAYFCLKNNEAVKEDNYIKKKSVSVNYDKSYGFERKKNEFAVKKCEDIKEQQRCGDKKDNMIAKNINDNSNFNLQRIRKRTQIIARLVKKAGILQNRSSMQSEMQWKDHLQVQDCVKIYSMSQKVLQNTPYHKPNSNQIKQSEQEKMRGRMPLKKNIQVTKGKSDSSSSSSSSVQSTDSKRNYFFMKKKAQSQKLVGIEKSRPFSSQPGIAERGGECICKVIEQKALKQIRFDISCDLANNQKNNTNKFQKLNQTQQEEKSSHPQTQNKDIHDKPDLNVIVHYRYIKDNKQYNDSINRQLRKKEFDPTVIIRKQANQEQQIKVNSSIKGYFINQKMQDLNRGVPQIVDKLKAFKYL